MKFAHAFTEQLQGNEYPSEWLVAAIRYRQLKKCIKKVQRELAELGLTADMLQTLAKEKVVGNEPAPKEVESNILLKRRDSHDSRISDNSTESSSVEFDEEEWLSKNPAPELVAREEPPKQTISFSYWFDGTLQSFVPKLVLTVDSEDGGLPINVNLASETRRALEELVARQRQGLATTATPPAAEAVHVSAAADNTIDVDVGHTSDVDVGHTSQEGNDNEDLPPLLEVPGGGIRRKRRDSQHQVVIPLSSDHEFFSTLTHEISLIDILQTREEASITSHIVSLSDHITRVSKPTSLSKHSDLYPWREIFQLYTESGIFFSTRERDNHKQRAVEDVEAKIKCFGSEMVRRGIVKSFRNKKSGVFLGQFLQVNFEILRLLRFREINKTAMRKILKKFDKRTSLSASSSFPSFIASDPFLTSHLAKALCFTLQNRLLTLIPQLDDYLCPICSSISVKPVRLECSHVFCVRCLVKLQRERKRFCPICRGDVVLKADSSNLDIGLWNFLRQYFPKEAREKQMENEKEVALEQFRVMQSQGIGGLRRCVVM